MLISQSVRDTAAIYFCTRHTYAGLSVLTATVVCTRVTGNTFAAAFTVKLVATGTGACATNSSGSLTVQTVCCRSGTAYARNSSVSAAAICLSTLGCPGSVGFMNNRTNSLTQPNTYALAVGNCSKWVPTGSVHVRCTSVSATAANLTIAVPSLNTLGGSAVSNYFFAGCGQPNSTTSKCNPVNYFGAQTCTTANKVDACGGPLPSTGNNLKVVQLKCQCTSARWIVASMAASPTVLAADRVNGACL